MNAVEERGEVSIHLPTVSALALLRLIGARQVPRVVARRAHPAFLPERERQWRAAQPVSVPVPRPVVRRR